MIRAGIGGWTFGPWRGNFYPKGLAHSCELEFASRALNTIEINGTFYRTQTPDTFRKWADETPEGFVFSLKAPRYAVNKRVLAEAGPSIERFFASGVHALGKKLGPVLWQFAPTKRFEPGDFAAFLALLPREVKGLPLRHALEVRHESFRSPQFAGLAAKAGAAIVLADSDVYPCIEAETAGFTYARLMRSRMEEETGYASEELASWAKRAANWGAGGQDVFIYFIDGAKERAPAAAQAFLFGLN
ncbi:MAG: DUF72 domain-containing protein [Rhodomicrobium sp.]